MALRPYAAAKRTLSFADKLRSTALLAGALRAMLARSVDRIPTPGDKPVHSGYEHLQSRPRPRRRARRP